MTSGVPQGLIFGPLLFLVYVNNLPEKVRSYVSVFADDTELIAENGSAEDCEILKGDLDAPAD